jgi:hypothetical protein
VSSFSTDSLQNPVLCLLKKSELFLDVWIYIRHNHLETMDIRTGGGQQGTLACFHTFFRVFCNILSN